jgi:hypothetical protein
MATLREYFDSDLNRCLSSHVDWSVRPATGPELPSLRARISQDFDANAKYWSFFIPEGVDFTLYSSLFFTTPQTSLCVLSDDRDPMSVEMGLAGYSEYATSETLVFTSRIFLYIDTEVPSEARKQITALGLKFGFHVLVRDREYAAKRSAFEKPLAFISHDSRDKDSLVRELAQEMSKLMCPVWYDEYSLSVGQSLRSSIEKGLKETRKCVVILSPHFFSNSGWGKVEFDSVFTREILEKNNVILPVWHNVSVKEVYDYCPWLADRLGLQSKVGAKELARQLVDVVKKQN